MKKRTVGIAIALILALFAPLLLMLRSESGNAAAQSPSMIPATLTAAQMTGQPPLSPLYPFEVNADPGIPTLQLITGDANTDDVALERIVDYFDAHLNELQTFFETEHPVRLKVLFAMYVVHISFVYGEATPPTSLVEYLAGTYSHCGLYTRYQAEILDAFGITWRIMYHATAEHAWVEVPIDGEWEVFDPTVNVWIDRDGNIISEVRRQILASVGTICRVYECGCRV
jgi:hypothetical protein